MERRGGVWIAPEGDVPPGRMVDPAATDFWVSWQDGRALEDDVVHGAEAAIAWGRERASLVVIRLGHAGESMHFSAGDEHPADDAGLLPWPPTAPPPEGWWRPPPPPTLADVLTVGSRVERGETSAVDAAAWAAERLAVYSAQLDREVEIALVDLHGGGVGR